MAMAPLLTIGEFARMTHVSVKALRHYDDVGLLAPADIDGATGYRYYAVAQVPVAQAIRRFRDLDMPIDAIRRLLTDPDGRESILLEHLRVMEGKLDHTQAAVASLRALLEQEPPAASIEHRAIEPAPAVAIREQVRWDDAEGWLDEALEELQRFVEDAGLDRAGPDGALYPGEFFEAHVGEVVAFVPVRLARGRGRIEATEVAGGLAAVMVHEGPFSTLDTAYGALGSYVTERGIGADGPVRENYLATLDAEAGIGRTEVCWPITAR